MLEETLDEMNKRIYSFTKYLLGKSMFLVDDGSTFQPNCPLHYRSREQLRYIELNVQS